MNNLVFFCEDGKVGTELQECSPVKNNEDPKLKCFNVTEEPCYLRIFFHDDFSPIDLAQVYYHIVDHNLIDVDKSIGEMANEDLEYNKGSVNGTSFEIKCYNFKEAFECGVDLMEHFHEPGMGGWHTDRIAVMLSDEPSLEFAKKMEDGNEKIKALEKRVKELEHILEIVAVTDQCLADLLSKREKPASE